MNEYSYLVHTADGGEYLAHRSHKYLDKIKTSKGWRYIYDKLGGKYKNRINDIDVASAYEKDKQNYYKEASRRSSKAGAKDVKDANDEQKWYDNKQKEYNDYVKEADQELDKLNRDVKTTKSIKDRLDSETLRQIYAPKNFKDRTTQRVDKKSDAGFAYIEAVNKRDSAEVRDKSMRNSYNNMLNSSKNIKEMHLNNASHDVKTAQRYGRTAKESDKILAELASERRKAQKAYDNSLLGRYDKFKANVKKKKKKG